MSPTDLVEGDRVKIHYSSTRVYTATFIKYCEALMVVVEIEHKEPNTKHPLWSKESYWNLDRVEKILPNSVEFMED